MAKSRTLVADATAIAAPLQPGDYELSLPFESRIRTFLVHVPPQAGEGSPLPVVVNFHGAGSNAAQQCQYTGMNVTANRHGFIVVYPNGTGILARQRQLLSFNAGVCCGAAMRNKVDDVAFTEAVVSVLGEKIAVDPHRLYATGMSNGGMMAHRMAVDSSKIAAVASVAGQLAVTWFRPSKPVSVMEFHSIDDRRAVFDGRTLRARLHTGLPPVQTGIDRWVVHNECRQTPTTSKAITGTMGSVNEGQTVTTVTYGPGRDGTEVVLYRFTGVGHVWPGSLTSLPLLLGRATTLVDANEIMWAFFSAHPLASA